MIARNEAYGSISSLVHGYALNSAAIEGAGADAIAGDTKAGTLIAKDRYGNKYYENLQEELPRMIARSPPLKHCKLMIP